ncbi:MAG: hypothetical protein ACI8PP_000917 [Candidatus Pseudothioglobus sp.]
MLASNTTSGVFFVKTITTTTTKTASASTPPKHAFGNPLGQPLTQGSGRSAAHAAALQMIQNQYRKHFHCELQHSLPYSLSRLAGQDSEESKLVACTGYQPAKEGELFLEQYLDDPVEEILQRLTNKSVSRAQIVEIGGFAVSHKRHALPFMLQLAPILANLGFKTVVCTVTRPMQDCFRKLGIISTPIARADPSRVDVSNNAWGTYYDLNPVVLAGDIDTNIDKLRPLITRLSGH